jgi:hypothetical protein
MCYTGNVITDMEYHLRTGPKRKHSIERRHTMNFRGRNVQTQSDIVESAGANPADAVLDRMEDGQKTISLAMGITVESRARVASLSLSALPA